MNTTANEAPMIVSTFHAPGWCCVWTDGKPVHEPVVCFAVVEYRWQDGSACTVLPMVAEGGEVVLADEPGNKAMHLAACGCHGAPPHD